jgi:hypothetical protein
MPPDAGAPWAPWTEGKPIPPGDPITGDPEAGKLALLERGYVSCGIPWSVFPLVKALLGGFASEPPLPGRTGNNAQVPYNWTVFEDADGDCQRAVGDPPVILREGPFDSSVRTVADGNCISFAPTGFAVDLPDGVEAGHLLVCDERGTGLQAGTSQSAARGIAITRTGRAAITRDPDTLAGWELPCS